MKKLALLLIPALLALSACNNKSNPVNPSSGELPSSETSSEEPPRMPTIDELMEATKDGDYELTITIEDYDEGRLHDIVSYKVRKEGLKVAYLNSEYDEHAQKFVYEEQYYGNVVNEEVVSYYQENGHWLYVEDGIDEVESAYSLVGELLEIFDDIKTQEVYEWTSDAEHGTYHGEGRRSGVNFEGDLQLDIGFFSSLHIVTEDREDEYRQITDITASKFGTAKVNLPETPLSEIFVSMGNIATAMNHLNSYTIKCVQGETSYVGKVQIFRDARYMLIEWTYDGHTTLLKDEWDDHGIDSYYIYNFGGDQWQTTTKEVFESISSLIFVSDELNAYGDQDEFAQDVAEVVEWKDGEFSLSLESAIILDVKFDANTYVLSEMNVNGNNPTTYSYSNINSTEIIY